MIKLNKMTDYGAVLLSVMAGCYRREPMRHFSAAELARKSGLTPATTQKLLKHLARCDFCCGGTREKWGAIGSRAPPTLFRLAEICGNPRRSDRAHRLRDHIGRRVRGRVGIVASAAIGRNQCHHRRCA